ncbi:MAG: YcxB family protein [Crocinitomicaceae bacterium]|nr:YcxB family protein [Crocinitomicaceae bacterium]
MKLVYDFDLNDWMAFQENYLDNSKQFLRTKRIVTWMFPFIWLSIIVVEYNLGKFNSVGAGLFFIASVLWVLFYPKRYKNSALKRAKKLLAEGDNSGYLGKHEIELNNQEIKSTVPQSSTIMNWDGIKRYIETDQYYFLYNTAASALIIPKFKLKISDAEKAELDKLIKSKVIHPA